MADWFKFSENGLDEPRLQYAIGTLSEVTPVWLGILSECCRHKSGAIGWNDDEAYLFGFSRRLNVPVLKVNEAIHLLSRIKYIEVKDGQLTVLKWNDFQSEYMKRKHRENPKSVRRVSGQRPKSVRQEERRGEEKREDKNIPLSPLSQRVGGWFRRRSTTQWHPKELKALAQVEALNTSEEDLLILEAYYRSKAKYKRRDLQTLLNNWNGEIDRARGWKINPSQDEPGRNRGPNI